MGIEDWLHIAPEGMASDRRSDEVEATMKRGLAEKIESRVKTLVDPGIDLRSGHKAQAIRAMEEGGRIVIKEKGSPTKEASQKGIEDLFSMSDGVPKLEDDRMVFRTITEDQLFVRQTQEEQDLSVQKAVGDTIRMGLVDAHSEAVDEIERKYPNEKIK